MAEDSQIGKQSLLKDRDITQSRRRFISWSLILSLGAVIMCICGVVWSFIKPPKKKNSFGGIINGGLLVDLPEMDSTPKLVPEGRFWFVHDKQGVSALHSSCTHLECRFNWDLQKRVFICPCHGSVFGRDGTVLNGPAKRSLDRFPIKLVSDNGDVIRSSKGGTIESVTVDDLLKELSASPDGDGIPPKEKPIIHVQVDTGRKIAGSDTSTSQS